MARNDGLIILGTDVASVYTVADLVKEARSAVKGKGKLQSWYLRNGSGAASVVLVATYQQPDGWCVQTTVAL